MSTTEAPPRRAGRAPVPATDFAALFERWAADRRPDEPGWVRDLRKDAIGRFLDAGFPSSKSELWRYVDLRGLARAKLALAADASPAAPAAALVERLALPDATALLVFVDGVYAESLSKKAPEVPVRVDPLSQAVAEGREDVQRWTTALEGGRERPFLDLNAAFLEEGVLVRVPPGSEVPGPIHLLFLHGAPGGAADAPRATFPRVLVELEQGSRALLVEEHAALGAGSDLVDAVTQVTLGPDAHLAHVRLQDVDRSTFHLGSVDVELREGATWEGATLLLGGAVAREEVRVVHAGAGSSSSLHALTLADGESQGDLQVNVDHVAPRCTSRQFQRGVLDGRSRGVTGSRVVVHPGAMGTDSSQSLRSLLLGEGAIADGKPQLEVLADDVQCSHGATVGQLDLDALFFLRARGIGEAEARALLTLAFAAEVIDALPHDALRQRLTAMLSGRIAGGATRDGGRP